MMNRIIPLVILIVLLVFIDRYLAANDSTWSFLMSVWAMIAAFILIGFTLCYLALYSYLQTTIKAKPQYQTEKEAYRQSVDHDVSEKERLFIHREKTLKENELNFYQKVADGEGKIKKKLAKKARELEAELKEAHEIKADAERLIIEKQAENEKYRQSAFNATSTVKRLRKRIEKLEKAS